jgi:two-component system, sensor histidine kinase LadS
LHDALASEQHVRWRWDTRKGFLKEVAVWLVGPGGQAKPVFNQSSDARFDQRPIAYRNLLLNLDFPAGLQRWLYVRYRTSGLTELPLVVECQDQFAQRSLIFAAKRFMSQGVMSIVVLAGLITFVASRARTPLMYSAYLLGYGLFVFQRDGFAFQFLWSSWPSVNAAASLAQGGYLVIAGCVFVRMFLRTCA